MIIRDVPDEVQFPALVGLIAQISLVVEIVWLVLALGFHGSQEIGGTFISYAVEPRQFLGSQPHVSIGSQQTGSCASFYHRFLALSLQSLVGDVESRTHLVAIFRPITAGREANLINHVRVDDGKTFLLTASDEEWAIYFHIIYIYGVFIERTATNVVLRRKFAVGTHARLLLDDTLHGVSAGRRSHLDILDLDFLGLVGLDSFARNVHLT